VITAAIMAGMEALLETVEVEEVAAIGVASAGPPGS